MKNKKIIFNKKPAITLAEILIVVTIVAIIGGIFIAMPKSNVSLADRTKYYIAYTTLQHLLGEQIADNGRIALSATDQNCTGGANVCNRLEREYNTSNTFGQMVRFWLNDVQVNDTSAILSNGMYFDWSGNETKSDGITTEKAVFFDIDGIEEGRNLDTKDRHYFLLSKVNGEPRVKPITQGSNDTDNSNSSWIKFKVFKINDNGSIRIVLLDADYTTAYNCYDGVENVCRTCSGEDCCKDKNCFIEPIPPMK